MITLSLFLLVFECGQTKYHFITLKPAVADGQTVNAVGQTVDADGRRVDADG